MLQLVKSFRNSKGLPRQRVLASLGDTSVPIDERGAIAKAVELRDEESLFPARLSRGGALNGSYAFKKSRSSPRRFRWLPAQPDLMALWLIGSEPMTWLRADGKSLRQRIEKGRLKKPDVIKRKIGAFMKKHPRVARFYKGEHKGHSLHLTRNGLRLSRRNLG